MNRYIYKLYLSTGETYIGQRTFKKDEDAAKDSYMGSSTFIQKYKRQKDIIRKEILLQWIKDQFTLNLLETVAFLYEKAETTKNVNYSKGGYAFNFVMPAGHPISKEAIQKMIETRKQNGTWTYPESEHYKFARKGKQNGMFGKTHSAEVRKRLSSCRKGKPGIPHTEEFKNSLRGGNNPSARGVICLDDKRRFSTLKAAGDFYGICSAYICAVCRKEQKTTKGKRFMYLEEYNENFN